tara:strand:+ start:123 stop:1409 length:1287 start_codon:yes stop_codon:yes gene_type:complete
MNMMKMRLAFLGARALVSSLLVVYGVNAAAQIDALSLESAPVEKIEEVDSTSSTKIFIEGSVGNASQRYGAPNVDFGRASVDLTYSTRFGTGLRLFLSDRLDVVHPKGTSANGTVNSLREAYFSWQATGSTAVDVGRINLRNGPAYGYNPTDFFRDGSLRVLTSADPFVLRQNRIGSVMVRGQKIWDGGSLSFAYSPKLATRPGVDGWSLDLGSTNNRDRALVTVGTRFSESLNSQIFLYKEEGASPSVGANLTALLSDAATGHLEWTYGREPDLLSHTFSTAPTREVTRSRFSGGVTYTTLSKTSVTAEYQYNGFGLNKSGWDVLAATPGAQLAYLQEALRRQELAPRQAFLLYVTQKDILVKDLNLTAYLRVNVEDRSKLAWFELRHHWPNFDLSLQVQQNIGRANSEFGVLPDRRLIQVLGTYYF